MQNRIMKRAGSERDFKTEILHYIKYFRGNIDTVQHYDKNKKCCDIT